jgi:hypothetical protein
MGDAALVDRAEDERLIVKVDAGSDAIADASDASAAQEVAVSVGDSSVDASASDAAALDANDTDASEASRSLRVLFVGNSYTYVNDLPAMLTTDREFAAGLSEDDAAALRSVAADVGRGR